MGAADSLIEYSPGLERDFDILMLDTEFSRLPAPGESFTGWRMDVVLLSVGVAAAAEVAGVQGEYYAYRRITTDERAVCSAFTIEHVLPWLDNPRGDEAPTPVELIGFLGRFVRKRAATVGKPLAVCATYIGDLLLTLPAFPRDTRIVLSDELADLPELEATYLRENGARAHHALEDARALRWALPRAAAKGARA